MSKPDINEVKKHILEAPIADYIGEKGAQIFAEKVCAIRQIKDSEFLFRQGEVENNLYILISGRLAFVKENGKNDSNPDILHVLTKGDLVGELSFIDDTPHDVSAMALGDAEVLCFSADDVRPLITEQPQLMFDFMRAVVKRVHGTVTDLGRQQIALSSYIYTAGKKG